MIWPLLHMPSFRRVTDPRTDLWLVRMVAVAIGAALALSVGEPVARSMVVLTIGSAAAFLAIDLVYVAKKVIGPIYLLDALPEVRLIVGWAILWLGG